MAKARIGKSTMSENNKLDNNPNTCSENQQSTHSENKLERRRRIEDLHEERRIRRELSLF